MRILPWIRTCLSLWYLQTPAPKSTQFSTLVLVTLLLTFDSFGQFLSFGQMMLLSLWTPIHCSACSKAIRLSLDTLAQLASFMEELHSDGLLDEEGSAAADPSSTDASATVTAATSTAELGQQSGSAPSEIALDEPQPAASGDMGSDAARVGHSDTSTKEDSSSGFIGPAMPQAGAAPGSEAMKDLTSPAAIPAANSEGSAADDQVITESAVASELATEAAPAESSDPAEQRVGLQRPCSKLLGQLSLDQCPGQSCCICLQANDGILMDLRGACEFMHCRT